MTPTPSSVISLMLHGRRALCGEQRAGTGKGRREAGEVGRQGLFPINPQSPGPSAPIVGMLKVFHVQTYRDPNCRIFSRTAAASASSGFWPEVFRAGSSPIRSCTILQLTLCLSRLARPRL